MLHALLARAAWIFGGIVVAAIAAFAAMVDRAPSPPPPVAREVAAADLFAQHCGLCHDAATTSAVLRGKPDRERARQDTVAFLRSHAEASDEEDVRIVGFLLDGPGPASVDRANPGAAAGTP